MKQFYIILFWVNSGFAVEFLPHSQADLPAPALQISYAGSEFEEVLVNEWKDVVMIDGIKRQFLYQQGYNYKKKEGFSRTVNSDGSVYHQKYSVDHSTMVSQEEMMVAFEVFKNNPEVKNILSKETLPISLYGGFSFNDKKKDEPCYKGNRCVHIMASSESNSLIVNSIVKLNDKTVPYPVFDMKELKKRDEK